MRRTGICGALETLLVDRDISEKAVPIIVKKLIESGCHIRGDIETKEIVNEIELASEKDWHTEYLDAILSIKLVDGVSGAIDHISKYSSNHTESIITENTKVAETFLLMLIAQLLCITLQLNLRMEENLEWVQK